MKKTFSILLLISLVLLVSCKEKQSVEKVDKDIVALHYSQVITKDNEKFIGKQMVQDKDFIMENTKRTDLIKVFDHGVDETRVTEVSINKKDEFTYETPGVIMLNAWPCLYTLENKEGFNLSIGDSITYEFEMYPFEDGKGQPLRVGIVKNGEMADSELYTEVLNGEYKYNVEEDGTYYIYVFSAASDYLSLKDGIIKIEN